VEHQFKRILRCEYTAVILLILLCFIFYFAPKFKEADDLNRQIRQARAAVKTLTKAEKDQQIAQLNAQLAKLKNGQEFIQQTVNGIKTSVPADKSIPLVTLEIEDLAVSSKIELASVKPIPNEDDQAGDYAVFPIEVGFQSTYPQLVKFISSVERSSPLIAVRQLKIQKDEMAYPLLDVRLTVGVLLKQEAKQEISVPGQEADGKKEDGR
jgi:Tfp pilus assembly protein PilO